MFLSKTKLYAILAALFTGLLAWLRLDAKRDAKQDAQFEDHEHAQDINDRVSDSRADPNRLRKFENAGFRD